jgi:biotin carboxyl carrier protein
MDLIPLVFMATVVVLIVVGQRWQTRRALTSWREAALGLGLNLKGTGSLEEPVMYGVIDGIPVHATVEYLGSGRNRTRYTVVRADVGVALPRGFKLSTEGLATGLLKMLGEQDIQLGDPVLDDKLLVQGSQPGRMRELLRRPDVRRAVLACFEHGSATTIEDDQVCVVVHGLQAAGVTTLVRDAVETARALAEGVRGGAVEATAPAVAAARALHPEAPPSGLSGVEVVPVPGAGRHEVLRLARVVAGPGAEVQAGDVLCELFAAQGTVEVRAPSAGVVEAVLAEPGDSLRAGAPLVRLWPDAAVAPPPPDAGDPFFVGAPLGEAPGGGPAPVEVDRGPVRLWGADPEVPGGGLAGVEPLELLPVSPPEPVGVPAPEPVAAPEPLPPPEPVAAPEPVAVPERVAVPAREPVPAADPTPPEPAGDLPAGVRDTLDALAGGRVPLSQRDGAVAAHAELPLRFALAVEDVRWTSGLFLPEPLRQGRTATGTVVGTGHALAVRFPATRNAELDAARGGTVTVVGRLAEWDDLYRRALVDDEG